MKNHIIVSIIFLFIMACQNKKPRQLLQLKPFAENRFNTEIKDDLRYIEENENDNQKVLNWIDGQNNLTETTISKIAGRTKLINVQQKYDKNASFKTKKLQIVNGAYFYLKQHAEENTYKLYYRENYESPETLIYDPKFFDIDKEYVINYFKPSWSAKKIAISLTEGGKEISKIIIVDVISKKIDPVIIKNTWPGLSSGIQWLPNDIGFTYPFFPVLDKKSKDFKNNSEILYYKLGADPNNFVPLFSKKNNKSIAMKESDFPSLSIKNRGDKYILASVRGGNQYKDTYIAPTKKLFKNVKWTPLFSKEDQIDSYFFKGDSIIYRTPKNAPNFKICITSVINPNFQNPKILVAEKTNGVITDFAITKEGLFYTVSKNGVEALLYHRDNSGKESQINLPEPYGSIDISSSGITTSKLWFNCRGWTTPLTRFELENGELKVKNLVPKNNSIDTSNIIAKEILVKGHDNEMIPLSVIYKKGTKLDGSSRVLMDGYGAYGRTLKPIFGLRRMMWVNEGGIYATAHVRGSGAKGDAWHKGGFKETKPNTWKDFISCAEFLINEKYTSKDKLAIWSGSAGGILIGRAITERPDLFKAAIVEFGILNALRFDKITGSASQEREFGTTKTSLGFKSLFEMDAYQHLKDNTNYPATLLTHGLNDPRVAAWQTLKFAAKIQHYNSSNNPNLVLIDKNSGHAQNDTKTKQYERYANIMAFALWQTGHPGYQLKE